jgi:hypothetical protein
MQGAWLYTQWSPYPWSKLIAPAAEHTTGTQAEAWQHVQQQQVLT